jgi:hypothetical protein
MITTLIDKLDGFEIVRDQILTILVSEIASQQALAVTAGKDPDLWKIRVFSERSNPWEIWLNDQSDLSPICNVWVDNMVFPEGSGNVVERQKNECIYNLDCYGCDVSADDGGTGHTAGDRGAAYTAHRAIRLIRNILMSAEYRQLGLPPRTVWKRWINSITPFQPEFNNRTVQQVVGARIAFRVEFNELSPQHVAETLEYISTIIRRQEDGEILTQVDVDFTSP